MAEHSTTSSESSYIQSSGNNNYINLNFISITNHFPQNYYHHDDDLTTSPSRHSILTFTASALINFIEIKYQGKDESPFETHPRIMLLAVTSLILYFLAFDVSSRFSASSLTAIIWRFMMVFFGLLSLAALLSVLLPESLCPFVISVSILFSLREFPLSKIVLYSWNAIREAFFWVEISSVEQQRQPDGSIRLVTEYPFRLLETVFMEEHEIDTLPV
ncbi:OLC1v1031732C1 [Oldenlandia corymbosa var. corymbosa]|uniref:OLC1v1031732C1 n=1 Tax=Oldenlandia corymbosa var. corymbosa TaxID=529605 RepID=A0AAV1CK05_OLDCO|nr:OLC1v1031732C1 [Oldenlandia corymbosa var. corymbosa]